MRFIDAYVVDFNFVKACAAAGFKVSNSKNASARGCVLLSEPAVQEEIQKRFAAARSRASKTLDDVIAELEKIGFANIEDLSIEVNEGEERVLALGSKSNPKINRDVLAAVSEMTTETYTDGHGENARDVKRTKIKLFNKKDALVDLGKHLGGFVTRNANTDTKGRDVPAVLAPVHIFFDDLPPGAVRKARKQPAK